MESFRKAHWLDSKGNVKKTINYRTKHIKLENIEVTYEHWDKNPDLQVVKIAFDVHFETDTDEAILHRNTYWACGVEDHHNIKNLCKELYKMDRDIRNQMIFTDNIDNNLYSFYELGKKGWRIIRQAK